MFSNRSTRLAVKARVWNPSQGEWKLAAQCVQREEKERIGKFVFKRDAKMAMAGRLLLRFAVAKVLGVPCRSLQFGRSDKGKPYLASPVDKVTPQCNLNFNISHQGDYVVFASDKDSLIGIDVMKIEWPRNKPISEFFSNMKRQLTPHEWNEVEKWSGDLNKLKTFYRFWCLKESLVKALGTGIGFEVGRLEFHLNTPELMPDHITTDTKVKVDGLASDGWSFEETMLEDHCIAVALQRSTKCGLHLGLSSTNTTVYIAFILCDFGQNMTLKRFLAVVGEISMNPKSNFDDSDGDDSANFT